MRGCGGGDARCAPRLTLCFPSPTSRIPLRSVFLTSRLFAALAVLVAAFVGAFFWDPLFVPAKAATAALALALLADVLALYALGGRLDGERAVPAKLSLGDPNPVDVSVRSTYPFASRVVVLDEVPVQFQARTAGTVVRIAARGMAHVSYSLRPTARGAYGFGWLLLYAGGPLGLARRRFRAAAGGEAVVYPSILQMQRYAFLATSDRLQEAGVRRVRRLGQTMEFDQVRAYVPGDDRRSVNWKATARRGATGGGTALYVNTYQEERAQPVVAALDMGRAMRAPFDGLTLVDHAINASLVLLNTALLTDDRAGLVAFDQEVRTVLRPTRTPATLPTLLDALYRLDPGFRDPSFEALYGALRTQIRTRALVLLFTNIDTVAGLERQLPYLRQIARMHRLCVVLFENTGIRALLTARSERLEDVYVKAVAEGLALETREVARTLERTGIGALVTRPESVTADAVNRYLQIRSRGAF